MDDRVGERSYQTMTSNNCDRCGARRDHDNRLTAPDYYWELCSSCVAEILDWMGQYECNRCGEEPAIQWQLELGGVEHDVCPDCAEKIEAWIEAYPIDKAVRREKDARVC